MRSLVIIVLIGFAAVLAETVLVMRNGWYEMLSGEDNLIEDLSALFFLMAFVLASIDLMRRWGDTTRFKVTCLVIVCSLIGFLDEVSFGERYFELSMPVLMGKKIDGVHDLFALPKMALWRVADTYGLPARPFVYGIFALTVLSGMWIFRHRLIGVLKDARSDAPLAHVILALLFVGAAQTLDLTKTWEDAAYVEELLEALGGLSLLVASWHLLLERRPAAIAGANAAQRSDFGERPPSV